MNNPTPFFSLDLQQPVNQWLGIALISLMCFVVVLFYLTNRTEAFADNVVSSGNSRIDTALNSPPTRNQ